MCFNRRSLYVMYFNWDILYLWCILIGRGDAAVEDAIKRICALDALIAHHCIALHCIALIADHWSPMIHIVGIPTTLPYSIPFLPIHDPSYVILASKLPLDCSNNTFGIDLPNFWQCLGTLHMLKNVCHVGGASHIFNARSLKSEMTRSQGLRGSFSRLTGNLTW